MFTLIVPAHNEAKCLEKSIDMLANFLKKNFKEKYVIVISEDGSTDGTGEIAKHLSKKYGFVKHLHSDIRLGKGGALKKAADYLEGDLVLFVDSDLPIVLENLKSMMDILRKGAEAPDIVIGSRYTRGSTARRKPHRMFVSKAYMLLVNLLFGLKLRDAQCGFKGFKSDVFKKLCEYAKENGWLWDTEMLIKAREMAYDIEEMPVFWEERGDSRINVAKESWNMFWGLIRLKIDKGV
jgi:glycosyltransferase involved in cell wall biosynthesis